jgi:plasmid stabilization system protein ParE
MAYKVRLTRLAEEDAYAAYEYIRENAPSNAGKWLTSLFDSIMSLADMPDRCPIINEAQELDHQARHLLYGKRAGTYRIIFDIQEDSDEGRRVRVLRIWHAYRNAIKSEDINTDLY